MKGKRISWPKVAANGTVRFPFPFASKYMLNRLFDILPACLSASLSVWAFPEEKAGCGPAVGQVLAIQLHFIKFYSFGPSSRRRRLVAFSGHCARRVRVLKRKLRQETPDS